MRMSFATHPVPRVKMEPQQANHFDNFQIAPEPSTAMLLMGGVGLLSILRRRRTKVLLKGSEAACRDFAVLTGRAGKLALLRSPFGVAAQEFFFSISFMGKSVFLLAAGLAGYLGGLFPMACIAGEAFEERLISADLQQIEGPLNTMFKFCVGAGRANEGLARRLAAAIDRRAPRVRL